MNCDTLLLLSKDELIGLILAQHGQIEALSARITELEARLGAPLRAPRRQPCAGRTPRQDPRGNARRLSALCPCARPCRPARSPPASTAIAASAPAAASASVRASPVVGSDETSARVGGKTWWRWVLLRSTAICHVIADTRAACVVTAFLDGARPQVWVADRYGGKLGRGAVRQVCTAFAPGFKWPLLRAMVIGRRRPDLKDSTLRHYHSELERRLDRRLTCSASSPAATCPQPTTPASGRCGLR